MDQPLNCWQYKNCGRTCWLVAGTLCGGKAQGTYAMKMSNCMACDFFRRVVVEEGKQFAPSKEVLQLLS